MASAASASSSKGLMLVVPEFNEHGHSPVHTPLSPEHTELGGVVSTPKSQGNLKTFAESMLAENEPDQAELSHSSTHYFDPTSSYCLYPQLIKAIEFKEASPFDAFKEHFNQIDRIIDDSDDR